MAAEEKMKLKIGDKFSSYEEFHSGIKKYMEQNFVDLHINKSRTLVAARKCCPKRVEKADPKLRYYHMKYTCVHGNDYRKQGNGIRRTSTLRKDCGAFIYVTLDDQAQNLVISSMSETHNHLVSEALYNHLPNQRKLPAGMKEKIFDVLQLQANKELIQDRIQKEMHKIVRLKDLSNLASKEKMSHNNLENVAFSLQEEHNCTVRVCTDENNTLAGLFIQDVKMANSFRAFPELMFADSTYKLLDLNVPIFILMIEDGNGQSEVVAIGLLVHEDAATLKWFFETFKSLNPAVEKTEVVMTDKDLTERSVLKEVMSNVRLRICHFHALRTFRCEITCDKMGITPLEREKSKEIFQRMCYASSVEQYEKLCKKLKSTAPQQVLEYFYFNWHDIKNEWTAIDLANSGCFLNLTNNRLECFNSKLKAVIPTFSSLKEFVSKLYIVLNSFRTERDANAANIFQKVRTEPFSSNDEKKYNDLLTPYAFNLVAKEIQKEYNMPDGLIVDQLSCNCIFWLSAKLPCRHIFAKRKESNLQLFEENLCNERWTKKYYYENHRIFQENNSSAAAVARRLIKNSQLEESGTIMSVQQKFRKAMIIATDISNLISLSSRTDFEKQIKFLEHLFHFWKNGEEVELSSGTNDFVQPSDPDKEANSEFENETNFIPSNDKQVPIDENDSNKDFTPLSANDKQAPTVKNENNNFTLIALDSSINDLKNVNLPTKIKKRGRPKESELTVIGLKRKRHQK